MSQRCLCRERNSSNVGIPERIRDLGGCEEQLPGFAEKAFALDRLKGGNPREVTLQDLEQILSEAF